MMDNTEINQEKRKGRRMKFSATAVVVMMIALSGFVLALDSSHDIVTLNVSAAMPNNTGNIDTTDGIILYCTAPDVIVGSGNITQYQITSDGGSVNIPIGSKLYGVRVDAWISENLGGTDSGNSNLAAANARFVFSIEHGGSVVASYTTTRENEPWDPSKDESWVREAHPSGGYAWSGAGTWSNGSYLSNPSVPPLLTFSSGTYTLTVTLEGYY